MVVNITESVMEITDIHDYGLIDQTFRELYKKKYGENLTEDTVTKVSEYIGFLSTASTEESKKKYDNVKTVIGGLYGLCSTAIADILNGRSPSDVENNDRAAYRVYEKIVNVRTWLSKLTSKTKASTPKSAKFITMGAKDDCMSAITEQAMKILKEGNPLQFLADTVNTYHAGDTSAIKNTILTISCAHVANSAGMHPAFVGESGKGKSDLARGVAHIAPLGKVLNTSLSPLALFYAAKAGELSPGTVVFSDDTTLNEDMRATIKRCTTKFQEKTYRKTVKDGEIVNLEIPERIVWWLTSVETDDSDQIVNRQLQLDVDTSDDQDERVWQLQNQALKTGQPTMPENERVMVAREVLRIACDGVWGVVAPYADRIVWTNKNNRRNYPLFSDVIRSITVLNRFQREINDGMIVSTEDDFKIAKELYAARAENQAHKMSNTEVAVYRLLSKKGECTLEEIMAETGRSETTARYLMLGRDGHGGLCAKLPGLTYEKRHVTSTEYDTNEKIGRPRNVFVLAARNRSTNDVASYASVVSLKDC